MTRERGVRQSARTGQPRLVVVFGHRSLDAMAIRAAARGLCDVIWLIDPGDPSAAAVAPLLSRSGPVVAELHRPPARAARALADLGPDGIATFYDTGMEHVAEISHALGLPFHTPAAGRALEDKLHQREALRDAALPTPPAVALDPGTSPDRLRALGAEVGYPSILKPRRASGSWQTSEIADERELVDRWGSLPTDDPEQMLLEGRLPDGPAPAAFAADYVSVETVVAGGTKTHVAITGRLPPAPPFRETGFFVPASVAPIEVPALLDLAGRALDAVGFAVGTAHTELKLTPSGPRVLEVNGRVGGGIPDLLRLSCGIDILAATMRAALGLPLGLEAMPRSSVVAYRFFYQPPLSAGRVLAIDGLERLAAAPGVEDVILHHPPGTVLDGRHGTRTYLFQVIGSAPDHRGVVRMADRLEHEVSARYESS